MEDSIDVFSAEFFRLDGKVAVVTGGNTNLGMAYATALARMGADIFLPHFEEDVSDVRAVVERAGRRISFLRGDLTDGAYRNEVVETCMEIYGRVDILINNTSENFAKRWLRRASSFSSRRKNGNRDRATTGFS
ncbi:MAG: SDR family NAD(P)-dependent oxidoreductase [Clostridiales Family XIII bacterium]|jgi:2-deoxy-D-gluconate 3-dehydrogenase|nr:SDR family NAD(P)-dependent oxidoreductase [Clostridiales Family XIII bacterium]